MTSNPPAAAVPPRINVSSTIAEIYPGVWKIALQAADTKGQPDAVAGTSSAHRALPPAEDALRSMPAVAEQPFSFQDIAARKSRSGLLINIPLGDREEVYGMGLQLKSLRQTGKKKTLRVNSDPIADTGDSHAPVPFYVSTAGYGVLVDTTRYASFYFGAHAAPAAAVQPPTAPGDWKPAYVAVSTEDLYRTKRISTTVQVKIPLESTADIYVFGGPTMRDAVRRYNLFSGGGALPPMWGLGVWYRTFGKFQQQEVLNLARTLRESRMPCDVLGLEPGWQTKAYSCSYIWNQQAFPDHAAMTRELRGQHFEINLWEHAFVHPTSPVYEKLLPLSGDLAVWKGLVPDFTLPEAREIFADYHAKTFVDHDITGFKLDECDHSDFISSPWSFPEHTVFPSGLDGEQMHSLFGNIYAQTIWNIFRQRNLRTLSQVRAGHAFAAPLPFVLYSDLYDQKDFLRGVVNSGFCGQLWSPEVRQCANEEDLVRRLQMVVLSPQALINAWMVPMPPWRQFDGEKNRAGELLPGWEKLEAAARAILELRMRLVPYLYSAFSHYHYEGMPVCRALVLDDPEDMQNSTIDDQYMLGPNLLVAPIITGQKTRRVYLPRGSAWVLFSDKDFNTTVGPVRYEGGQWIDFAAPDWNSLPLFVKDNTLLPLAEPLPYVGREPHFRITVSVYGTEPDGFQLYGDDGLTFDFEKGEHRGWLSLGWKDGQRAMLKQSEIPASLYNIVDWVVVG
ncbi:MAG TPA: TIM-barrel domain-containing protein [Candidatus Methylacidiphilales bacterium]|nr:TIM-barrel domain-containing protein [Candidatus Methylacidiphilales bacterium]